MVPVEEHQIPVIQDLKSKKAAGFENIPVKYYRYKLAGDWIANFLSKYDKTWLLS